MSMTAVALNEQERAAIIDAVRDFAQHRLAPHAQEWDQTAHFPRDVLAAAGELGLGGIYVADDVGGTALSRRDAVTIFEQLAMGDPAIAAYISIHNMVAWMIDEFGTPAQREEWLPRLVTMRELGAYCLTEPGAGSDAAAITTGAVRQGDQWVLTGVKQFISGAGEAAVYVVMARTVLRQAQEPTGQAQEPGRQAQEPGRQAQEPGRQAQEPGRQAQEPGAERPSEGITAFLVPADTPGLSFGAPEKKMGWNAQPTRQVIFDEVRVPASAVLGGDDRLGDGFRIAMRGLDGGRLNIAACSLGAAQWALEKATRYVHERFTFGEPLAEKQAVVFALADMATDLHAARALLREAARALDEGAADAVMQCAMAKRFATDAGFDVANRALQLHGGYGYLQDYGLEKVVRDLRVHQILEGTNEIMRVIIGRRLLA